MSPLCRRHCGKVIPGGGVDSCRNSAGWSRRANRRYGLRPPVQARAGGAGRTVFRRAAICRRRTQPQRDGGGHKISFRPSPRCVIARCNCGCAACRRASFPPPRILDIEDHGDLDAIVAAMMAWPAQSRRHRRAFFGRTYSHRNLAAFGVSGFRALWFHGGRRVHCVSLRPGTLRARHSAIPTTIISALNMCSAARAASIPAAIVTRLRLRCEIAIGAPTPMMSSVRKGGR